MYTHLSHLFSRRALTMLTAGFLSIAGSFAIGVQTAGDVQPFAASEAAVDSQSDEAPLASVPGDVDGNGYTDVRDARLILEFATGLDDPSVREFRAADVNGDLRIDNHDALSVLHRLTLL